MLEIIAAVALYFVAGSLLARSKSSNKIVLLLKRMYYRTEYNNTAQILLASQMVFCFGACAAMTDRSLNAKYKLVNFGICVAIGFTCGIMALLHPFFLRVLKHNKIQSTDGCYIKARRFCSHSEKFVLCSIVVRTVVAVSVPLLPTWVALCLITSACILEIVFSKRTQFSAKVFKIFRVVYLAVLALLNLAILVLFTISKSLSAKANALVGYLCVGLIATNIVIEVSEIVVEFCKWLVASLRSCQPTIPIKHPKRILKMKKKEILKAEVLPINLQIAQQQQRSPKEIRKRAVAIRILQQKMLRMESG